jgi:predicted phosphohydrolase
MKIQVLSDLHIEFSSFEIQASDADVVVLAGDIHTGEKGIEWAIKNVPDRPVIYVAGNHEYYGNAYPKLINSLKERAFGTNVNILENDTILIKDIMFLGCTLWTDFELFEDFYSASYKASISMNDFRKIRLSPKYSKLRPSDTVVIHKKSLNWLKDALLTHKSREIVVVTHHAPSKKSIPARYEEDILSAAYASTLEHLIHQSNISLWIHGHVHDSFDYKIGLTRIVCNPRGYVDELNELFDPQFIVEI